MDPRTIIRLAAFNLDVEAKKQVLAATRSKLESLGLEPKGELDPPKKGESTSAPCAASHVVAFIGRIAHPDTIAEPQSLAKGAEPTKYQQQHLLSARRAYKQTCEMQQENMDFLQKLAGSLEKMIGHAPDVEAYAVDTEKVFKPGDPRAGQVNKDAKDPNSQREASEKAEKESAEKEDGKKKSSKKK